jgi:hypothetical protein
LGKTRLYLMEDVTQELALFCKSYQIISSVKLALF